MYKIDAKTVSRILRTKEWIAEHYGEDTAKAFINNIDVKYMMSYSDYIDGDLILMYAFDWESAELGYKLWSKIYEHLSFSTKNHGVH